MLHQTPPPRHPGCSAGTQCPHRLTPVSLDRRLTGGLALAFRLCDLNPHLSRWATRLLLFTSTCNTGRGSKEHARTHTYGFYSLHLPETQAEAPRNTHTHTLSHTRVLLFTSTRNTGQGSKEHACTHAHTHAHTHTHTHTHTHGFCSLQQPVTQAEAPRNTHAHTKHTFSHLWTHGTPLRPWPLQGAHLRPFCTTRLRHVLQQEQAWLHSNSRGGSAMLNSGSSRPSWADTRSSCHPQQGPRR